MIIGGGITGAGVARAASQRGLSVALLEAKDFSSGTSSKSSKLIHGGLRYLAMGHFRVVRHTARERAVVHALAPHLCEPHWMVFPVASRRWLVLMDVVVRIYEMLGGVKRSDRHRRWGRAEVAQNEPALRAEKSRYAVTFREYLTDDCRLVLANLRDAVASGAQVANYLSVDGLLGENQAEGVTAQCALTGRSIQVKAAVVVNATGPWVDATRQLEADVEPRLVLSRGIHVAVRRTDLPVNNLVTMTGSDGRPVFALPRGPVTYLGTTDTRHLEPATHHPSVEQIDVDFLLTTVEDHFDISLTPKQVTGAWAGLRPLISKPEQTTSELSRKDEVWVGPRGVVTVAGGKLTGYLQMADDVLEAVETQFSAEQSLTSRAEFSGTISVSKTLPGGDIASDLSLAAQTLDTDHGLGLPIAERLVRRYGSEADAVIALGKEPVAPGAHLLSGEIVWAVQVDGALFLADVLERRTGSMWFDPEVGALVEPVAQQLSGLLGWTAEQTSDQIALLERQQETDLTFT